MSPLTQRSRSLSNDITHLPFMPDCKYNFQNSVKTKGKQLPALLLVKLFHLFFVSWQGRRLLIWVLHNWSNSQGRRQLLKLTVISLYLLWCQNAYRLAGRPIFNTITQEQKAGLSTYFPATWVVGWDIRPRGGNSTVTFTPCGTNKSILPVAVCCSGRFMSSGWLCLC